MSTNKISGESFQVRHHVCKLKKPEEYYTTHVFLNNFIATTLIHNRSYLCFHVASLPWHFKLRTHPLFPPRKTASLSSQNRSWWIELLSKLAGYRFNSWSWIGIIILVENGAKFQDNCHIQNENVYVFDSHIKLSPHLCKRTTSPLQVRTVHVHHTYQLVQWIYSSSATESQGVQWGTVISNVQICTLMYTDCTLSIAPPKWLPVELKDFLFRILIVSRNKVPLSGYCLMKERNRHNSNILFKEIIWSIFLA